MLAHGDELGRTQGGNNNAYCHDSPVTWVHWDLSVSERGLLAFAQRVLALRRENPVLRRRSFFSGRPLNDEGTKDVTWLRQDGEEFKDEDWQDAERRVLGMLVSGEANDEVDERGRPVQGDSVLLLMNGGERPCYFRLPEMSAPGRWEQSVHTARPGMRVVRRGAVNLIAHSLMLMTFRKAT